MGRASSEVANHQKKDQQFESFVNHWVQHGLIPPWDKNQLRFLIIKINMNTKYQNIHLTSLFFWQSMVRISYGCVPNCSMISFHRSISFNLEEIQ
jgi:hypothetical protein